MSVYEIDGRISHIKIYENIICVPFEYLHDNIAGIQHKGGPIWHDWEDEPYSRYFFSIKPVDQLPDIPGEYEVYEKSFVYIGVLHRHYGHFIADICVPRIWSIIASLSKNLKFLVAAPFGILNFHKEILFNYFKIRNLKLLDRPMKIKKLYVAPQIERAFSGFYDRDSAFLQSYLEFIEEMTEKYLANFDKSDLKFDVIYVSRKNLLNTFLGEKYLADLLESLGIKVISPEKLSFKEQLYLYKHSSVLVFVEGSALHTLQFLGDLKEKKIFVINRRKEKKVAYRQLIDRGADVHYIDNVLTDNQLIADPQLPHFIDIENTLNELETAIGVPFLSKFNKQAYLSACKEHLEKFIDFWERSKNPYKDHILNSAKKIMQEFSKSYQLEI
jgi:hypothetical protein